MFILFLAFFLAAGYNCQTVPPEVLQDVLDIFYNGVVALGSCSNTEVLLSNIVYTLYTQENSLNGTVLTNTNLNVVNPQNRVIVIIHGWLQSGSESGMIEMKDVYLKQTAANVIIVDWSIYAQAFYGIAFCAVPQVGVFTGDLIYNLSQSLNINLNNIQINGFSLGAHVAGYTGQQIQTKTGGVKIGRINGLDAAGPGFLNLPTNQRLDANDAVFVQGIHTSNWQFGYTPVYATVDFEVNFAVIPGCGAIQSGCPFNPGVSRGDIVNINELLPYLFCNHVRAFTYFIESIVSTDFIAVKCDNCKKFGVNKCKSETTAIMGENCSSTTTGVYYLNVNPFSPFAKGNVG